MFAMWNDIVEIISHRHQASSLSQLDESGNKYFPRRGIEPWIVTGGADQGARVRAQATRPPRQRGSPTQVVFMYANPVSNWVFDLCLLADCISTRTACICFKMLLESSRCRRFFYFEANYTSCLRCSRNVVTPFQKPASISMIYHQVEKCILLFPYDRDVIRCKDRALFCRAVFGSDAPVVPETDWIGLTFGRESVLPGLKLFLR